MITRFEWEPDTCDCTVEVYYDQDKDEIISQKLIRACLNHDNAKTVRYENTCKNLDHEKANEVLDRVYKLKKVTKKEYDELRDKVKKRKPELFKDANIL